MNFKKVLLGFSLFIAAASFAQQVQKEVLFTINDKPYYTDEFIRVYNKNLELVKDDSQKDLNNYLDLFIGYKLKVNKANKLGLNEGKKYLAELKSYRSQLSKNYLTDTKVTKELVDEAYARSRKEVNASHILIKLDENASPADTLKAYNKAMEVRKRALAGEDFGSLATQFSEDPSAQDNKGELGYFTVFSMIYPFESAAYSTPAGGISMPVRTRFGYHIIRVNDVRDHRGEISVAHILIGKPSKESNEDPAKARNTINEIYQKLQQGEDFATLARQFSQDRSTAGMGGELARFTSGELSLTEFEDKAFSLKNPGDYSEPFETPVGWHIVKLIKRYPVKTQEEVQAEFEARIGRDDRSRIIQKSMAETLRAKYAVKKDAKAYAKAVKALNDKIYTNAWELPKDLDSYNQTLFTINNDKQFTAKDYLNYVKMHQRGVLNIKPVARQADALLEKYIDEQLAIYQNDNLEKDYPEFAVVMEEYRDGLLLFDLMEKEIWEKAKNDTIGLQKFYQGHINNYQWKDRIDADVYSSTNEDVVKKARKMLKKGKDAAYIKEELNTGGKVNIIEKAGVFELDSDALPKQQKWEAGISDVIKEGNYYYVVKTNKVLPQMAKTLEESRGRVINDYQQYLENTWVDGLKEEFAIKVNKDVFEKVKKQLGRK